MNRARFYLCRHGQTEWNVESRIQGWGNSPLTLKGRHQAELLSKRLADIRFDSAYSSSCGRALETADILLSGRNLTAIPTDGLREISFGDWESRRYEEVERDFPSEWHAFWKDPSRFRRNDRGEDFSVARKRLSDCFQDIARLSEGKTVLLVTHAVAMKLLLSWILSRPIDRLWEGPFPGETALTLVECRTHAWNVVAEADVSHLEE
jgi:probable phosphoglycerate mutase